MKYLGTELLIAFLITWMWFSSWHPWQVFAAAFLVAWLINIICGDILNRVKNDS